MDEVLTPQNIERLHSLRERGFAVVVFTPEELRGADVDRVQDRLIEQGWDVIDALATEPVSETEAN